MRERKHTMNESRINKMLELLDDHLEKNRYLHTGGKNHVFSPNCSLYRSDLGFSKTKFINFSTFSK